VKVLLSALLIALLAGGCATSPELLAEDQMMRLKESALRREQAEKEEQKAEAYSRQTFHERCIENVYEGASAWKRYGTMAQCLVEKQAQQAHRDRLQIYSLERRERDEREASRDAKESAKEQAAAFQSIFRALTPGPSFNCSSHTVGGTTRTSCN